MKQPNPIPKSNIDLDYIIDQCREYINFVSGPDYHEDRNSDMKNYVFEAVLESVYTPEIWDYINSKTDE